jgi:hypothetical protein
VEVSGHLQAPPAIPHVPTVGLWVGLRASLDFMEKKQSSPYRELNTGLQPLARRYTDWGMRRSKFHDLNIQWRSRIVLSETI